MELSAFERKAVEQVKLLKQQIKELQQRDQQRQALLEHVSEAVETMQAQLAQLHKNRGGGKFTPPTREELDAYFAEYHRPELAAEFYDFYQSKNWMVGKNKMVCWKSAAHGALKWERYRDMAEDRKPAEVRAEAMEQRSREVIEPLRRKRECVEDEAETERLKAEARKIAGVMKRSENEG